MARKVNPSQKQNGAKLDKDIWANLKELGYGA